MVELKMCVALCALMACSTVHASDVFVAKKGKRLALTVHGHVADYLCRNQVALPNDSVVCRLKKTPTGPLRRILKSDEFQATLYVSEISLLGSPDLTKNKGRLKAPKNNPPHPVQVRIRGGAAKAIYSSLFRNAYIDSADVQIIDTGLSQSIRTSKTAEHIRATSDISLPQGLTSGDVAVEYELEFSSTELQVFPQIFSKSESRKIAHSSLPSSQETVEFPLARLSPKKLGEKLSVLGHSKVTANETSVTLESTSERLNVLKTLAFLLDKNPQFDIRLLPTQLTAQTLEKRIRNAQRKVNKNSKKRGKTSSKTKPPENPMWLTQWPNDWPAESQLSGMKSRSKNQTWILACGHEKDLRVLENIVRTRSASL